MKEKSENSCVPFAEQISAYFDGQLAEELVPILEQHLQSCPRCARQLEEYKLLRNLMTAERQTTAIDLTSAVMGNLEREQLLSGLDLTVKPQSSGWGKFIRRLAAAAMIALIVSTALLVVHFTGNSARNQPLALNSKSDSVVLRNVGEIHGKNLKGREIVSEVDQAVGTPVQPAQHSLGVVVTADRMNEPIVKELPKAQASAQTSKAKEDYGPMAVGGSMGKMTAGTLQSAPQAPLVTQPCKQTGEDILQTRPSERPGQAWLVPLVYDLRTPDLPTGMLLKEQILEILKENRISPVLEPEELGGRIGENREFFYQARKGLDMPPGAAGSQILLVTTPEKFIRIHNQLQQSALEAVKEKLHPALGALIMRGFSGPDLIQLGRQGFNVLNARFAASSSSEMLTTSTAPILDKLENTSQSASAPADGNFLQASPTTTQSSEQLLPILIRVELVPTPVTTTASVHTTAPATTCATQPAWK